MTLSNITRALLVHLRRTVERTFHRVTLASATLTISFPPFLKPEIKTEPKPATANHRRRRRVANGHSWARLRRAQLWPWAYDPDKTVTPTGLELE